MFNKNRKITIGVMIAATALLIVWDIIAFLTGPSNDTESHVLLQFATNNFTLPFAMAGLLGHWFWPREGPPFRLSKGWAFFGVLVPVMLAMSVFDIFLVTPAWVTMWQIPKMMPIYSGDLL
jgi:hypothetical protein